VVRRSVHLSWRTPPDFDVAGIASRASPGPAKAGLIVSGFRLRIKVLVASGIIDRGVFVAVKYVLANDTFRGIQERARSR
jgi:hypothetical protein